MSRLNPLPYTYNIMNSMHLIQSLTNTPILPSYKFASLDITNTYSNIPTSDTRQILSNMLHTNTTNPRENIEILTWFDNIMQQNYFTTKLKLNSVALVRERTIPTERPPPVGGFSANFCG